MEDESIDELSSQEQVSKNDESCLDINEVPKMSWLLQVVLNNLGVSPNVSTVIICIIISLHRYLQILH